MRMEDDPVPLFDLPDLPASAADAEADVSNTEASVEQQEGKQTRIVDREDTDQDKAEGKEMQEDNDHVSVAIYSQSSNATNMTKEPQNQVVQVEKEANSLRVSDDNNDDGEDLLDQLLKDAAEASDEGKDPLCDQDENEIENLIKLSQQSLPQSLSSSPSSLFPASFSTPPSTISASPVASAGGDDEDLEEWLDSVI